MKGFLKRIHRDSKGFTLIELLVVVTILGILAAVVLPNFTGLTHKGETEAAKTELAIVQTATDTMMALRGLSTLAAPASNESDMTAFPDPSYPLYPQYIRKATTNGHYSVTENGTVTQDDDGYPLP